ncbi:hypothetical protein ROZALSC1DRAFT_30560 [Rozella allomycis CSF55]|uniref:Homeobox domain-containing protein n=1 Tax=Rozella allomycis (strain CSF55) TaxID=988480 RepID=A0A4P9YE80_ROZAC|nr:hypothetical protein ROZALSC1DRAFT_30560 [Rozella allomycis CSF55]
MLENNERTRFTHAHKAILESVFEIDNNPSKDCLENLAARLNLKARSIIPFMRSKVKRESKVTLPAQTLDKKKDDVSSEYAGLIGSNVGNKLILEAISNSKEDLKEELHDFKKCNKRPDNDNEILSKGSKRLSLNDEIETGTMPIMPLLELPNTFEIFNSTIDVNNITDFSDLFLNDSNLDTADSVFSFENMMTPTPSPKGFTNTPNQNDDKRILINLASEVASNFLLDIEECDTATKNDNVKLEDYFIFDE